MGVFYEEIPDSLVPWIKEQNLLFVGTAPLSSTGHINISPKGGKDFGILSPTQFWYLDLTGSGVETHAHLHEPDNGRICVMFVAFTGPPRILRIWGKGRAVENGTSEYADFVAEHDVKTKPGARSIILIDVCQVSTSCGFSVPYYDFKEWRHTLDEVFSKKQKKFEAGDEKESMDRYWAWKSQLSIDNLPGMQRAVTYAETHNVEPLKKMVGKHAPLAPRAIERVSPISLLVFVLIGVSMGFVMAVTMVNPETVRALQSKKMFDYTGYSSVV